MEGWVYGEWNRFMGSGGDGCVLLGDGGFLWGFGPSKIGTLLLVYIKYEAKPWCNPAV